MKRISFAYHTIISFMKNQMQTKSSLLYDVFSMLSRCALVFLLYHYVFKLKGGIINGTDYKTTMWSMFIYFCIMILNLRKIDTIIMDEVKSGNVETQLNRPISFLNISIYKGIGQGLYSFVIISIIGIIVMLLTIGVPTINPWIFYPTFILTFILGQILAVIIYSIVGLLSFFIEDIKPIHWIVDKFVMVLGGSYLPVSMFPYAMKVIAYISPFGAINFASSTVYSSWNSEWIYRIIIQIIWIISLYILMMFIYKKSKEKAMINGG